MGGAPAALCVAALLLAALPPAAGPPPPACAPLCHCHGDHLSCNLVPFHRFPAIGAGVRHVSVTGARLGALDAAALDAAALRTLVLAACRLHRLDPAALASMAPTLASLDLSQNEFTEVPLEALRHLKVLNWLDLQNNRVAELDPAAEWGALADSLSSLSLAHNQLRALHAGALAALRQLAQLDLDGNRLHALAARSLPPALALLRLSDNLLPAPPCAALEGLPRLRQLRLRANALRPAPNGSVACPALAALDSLDLAANELDDRFALTPRPRPRRLSLELNRLTALPAWLLRGGARLERLSLSHNRIARVPAPAVRALGALARLDLDRNRLLAAPDLAALGALRRLDLAHNGLRALPRPPPRLRWLSLAGNRLAAPPAGLRRLRRGSLLHLDLGYNLIAALEASAFGAWSEALETLNLRGNRLARLAPDAFPPAMPLRELALGFNPLERVQRGALAGLPALRALELSSAPAGGAFPAPGAPGVAWLSLDNNGIRHVSAAHLLAFPSLEYLNLDFNEIEEFPGEAVGPNSTAGLRELRLSFNRVGEVRARLLSGARELRLVDLSHNRARLVGELAFDRLPALRHLDLAGNLLERLAPRAFRALPRLEALLLHDNRLEELRADSLELGPRAEGELTLNASRNRIGRLAGGAAPVPLAALDLSHNRLAQLAPAFFAAVGAQLRRLELAHNRLVLLDAAALGALPRLQALAAPGGALSALRRRAPHWPALHALDLAGHALRQLGAEQFRGLRQLRHLRLAANELGALPRDCLRDTALEHLDLADNRLALFPAAALAAVGFTLRRLELAGNRLERLDPGALAVCAELRELSLAGNRLSVLPDGALAPLGRLHALDLSGNRLEADWRQLLLAVPRLRRLALADAALRAAPALPLPELAELDLSGNRLTALRGAGAGLPARLRSLSVARNALTSLRPALGAALPLLVELDASDNPIARLALGSLAGLPRLRSLRLERLRRLEAVEPRAFLALGALRELALDAPLGRAGAPLAGVLDAVPSLEALTLSMRGATLGAELRGVRAGRLRAVEVRGRALRSVSADAFEALGAARALTLRVRGTSVARLPEGLLRPLAGVAHLALDLSDNELAELAPESLFPNRSTEAVAGGLLVGGNPLRCGCGVRWLGAWLRRWTGEVGAWSGRAREAARASDCGGAGGARRPLLALSAPPAPCRARAARAPPARALLWAVLLCSVR